MNVLVVAMMLLASPAESNSIPATPLLSWQGEEPFPEHDHMDAMEEEEEGFARPRRKSYLLWTYEALGIRYTVLLPGSGFLVFLGSLLVVCLCKRPATVAAFFPIVLLPAIIGFVGTVEGLIIVNSIIATSSTMPKPSAFAQGTAMAWVTLLVGILVTMPAYLVTSVGLFIRTLTYRAAEE